MYLNIFVISVFTCIIYIYIYDPGTVHQGFDGYAAPWLWLCSPMASAMLPGFRVSGYGLELH